MGIRGTIILGCTSIKRTCQTFFLRAVIFHAIIGACSFVVLADSALSAGVTLRVGLQTGIGSTFEAHSISGNGRYVAFGSIAPLVPEDTNGVIDIYVTDASSGATSRVSTSSAGEQGAGNSHHALISADGRYVAFDSFSSNLVANDTNGVADIFVKDTKTGETSRVNTNIMGGQVTGGNAVASAISANGRYVAFNSGGSFFGIWDAGGSDIYLKDRLTNQVTRVSMNLDGVRGGIGEASVSADGRYVAFSSSSSNLVPGDTNGITDIFLKDTLTGAVSRVSTSTAGVEANVFACYDPVISADGSRVAFISPSSTLVEGDTNGNWDVFVKDIPTGITTRANTMAEGAEVSQAGYPSISGDGRYVSFTSYASNLVPGDTNNKGDIFVKDTLTGAINMVSNAGTGEQANEASYLPDISLNAQYVAFQSKATNLVPGDTNGETDVFLATSGFAATCDGQAPVITLNLGSVYWASYSEYLQGRLSVEYAVTNSDTDSAYNFFIENVFAYDGAIASQPSYTFQWKMDPGTSVIYSVKYVISASVSSFRTSIQATAQDACGNSFSYPAT